jgi:hypothetical protein
VSRVSKSCPLGLANILFNLQTQLEVDLLLRHQQGRRNTAFDDE